MYSIIVCRCTTSNRTKNDSRRKNVFYVSHYHVWSIISIELTRINIKEIKNTQEIKIKKTSWSCRV